jgi:hypothetical protein
LTARDDTPGAPDRAVLLAFQLRRERSLVDAQAPARV